MMVVPRNANDNIISKSWVIPKNEYVVKVVGNFIPFFLILVSIMIIYRFVFVCGDNDRVINDKVTGRTRILYLNNVTSALYITSLLVYYFLFLLVITIM